MNLYYFVGAIPASSPTVVSTNPGSDGWVFEGCYSDFVGVRTLANSIATSEGGSVMTVVLCIDTCHAAGYTLAKIEYASQYYCDNSYINGGLFADLSNCNITYSGNSSEYCSGPSAMNLYSYEGVTLHSHTPTLGCYTDNVGSRALANQLNVLLLIVEKCISRCFNAGWTIAGVEYGDECYCDNGNGGVFSSVDTNCTMTCSGNAAEMCSGPNLLNLYSSSALQVAPVPSIKKTGFNESWVYQGCFTNVDKDRDIGTNGVEIESLTSMTTEYCLGQCYALDYDGRKTEYSKQCCEYPEPQRHCQTNMRQFAEKMQFSQQQMLHYLPIQRAIWFVQVTYLKFVGVLVRSRITSSLKVIVDIQSVIDSVVSSTYSNNSEEAYFI
ncbi:WSC-domain-containing protein [Acephala macrosclerotiorum]|nr:WSC-domain-containing protein [Acephala macrosclerotiorum]